MNGYSSCFAFEPLAALPPGEAAAALASLVAAPPPAASEDAFRGCGCGCGCWRSGGAGGAFSGDDDDDGICVDGTPLGAGVTSCWVAKPR